jgi:hypothetical protein
MPPGLQKHPISDQYISIAIRSERLTWLKLLSVKEKTMRHAISEGKVTAGDCRPKLSPLRRELKALLSGMAVDISIILKGGAFDLRPTVKIRANEDFDPDRSDDPYDGFLFYRFYLVEAQILAKEEGQSQEKSQYILGPLDDQN